jgi:hypothetical protein
LGPLGSRAHGPRALAGRQPEFFFMLVLFKKKIVFNV